MSGPTTKSPVEAAFVALVADDPDDTEDEREAAWEHFRLGWQAAMSIEEGPLPCGHPARYLYSPDLAGEGICLVCALGRANGRLARLASPAGALTCPDCGVQYTPIHREGCGICATGGPQ